MIFEQIIIGSDHAGFVLKSEIIRHLSLLGLTHRDVGCYSGELSDYPIFAKEVAFGVQGNLKSGVRSAGVLICGSGVGVSIVANKFDSVRASLCCNHEIARLARKHNDANVICLGARFTEIPDAIKMVDVFLDTPFDAGRHSQRVAMID